MKQDNIEKLFESKKGQFNIDEPSLHHKARFFEKLQEQEDVVQLTHTGIHWRKVLTIAASVLILFGISFSIMKLTPKKEVELATVSPQMEETQSFFTSTIEVQLEEINKISSPETTKLVSDAMEQLKKLEADYEHLKKDLFHSGNDKRVISAMIRNFQKRASLLENVLEKIDDINNFKTSKNESPII